MSGVQISPPRPIRIDGISHQTTFEWLASTESSHQATLSGLFCLEPAVRRASAGLTAKSHRDSPAWESGGMTSRTRVPLRRKPSFLPSVTHAVDRPVLL